MQAMDPRSTETVPAAGALRLQVMPGWDHASLAHVVSTPVGRTFDAVVVHPDEQGRPTYLSPAVADTHFGGAAASVERALQQTVAELAPALQVEDALLDDHLVRRLSAPGHPLVPVVLVSLDRFLPGPARSGSAVVVPSYDEVMISCVDNRADLDVVPGLRQLAHEHHQRSDLPFSPEVFWYLDGTFYAVEAEPSGRVNFPAELGPALAALG